MSNSDPVAFATWSARWISGDNDEEYMVDESMFSCPYILSSSSSLSANANISAGIGRDGGSMSIILNGDVECCEGVVARMIRRVGHGEFGVCGVLFGSESSVSAPSA